MIEELFRLFIFGDLDALRRMYVNEIGGGGFDWYWDAFDCLHDAMSGSLDACELLLFGPGAP